MKWLSAQLAILALSLAPTLAGEPPSTGAPLIWDTVSQEYNVRFGETNASFAFQMANPSGAEVVLTAVRPTCECTVPVLPSGLPWRIGAEQSAPLRVNVDLRDRWESFKQTIAIETAAGTNRLSLQINMPEPTPRERNQHAAFADRQAVFKGDCAKCHLHPAAGKVPALQFGTLCGTCHEAEVRAEMVPALPGRGEKGRAYWENWMRRGKAGTWMPAFAKRFGGPLTDPQMEALLDYLTQRPPMTPAR